MLEKRYETVRAVAEEANEGLLVGYNKDDETAKADFVEKAEKAVRKAIKTTTKAVNAVLSCDGLV